MNFNTYLPTIKNLIQEYGKNVTIYRDIYANELGTNVLKQKGFIVANIDIIIDNSENASSIDTTKDAQSIIKPYFSAKGYYIYDGSIELKYGDYFILDGIKYIMNIPVDLVHTHLVYQVKLEGVDINGR